MATIKISELPVATSLANVDVSPIVQGGATKQANVTVIASAVNTALGLGTISTQSASNVSITGGTINSATLANVTISSGNAVFSVANATTSTITNLSSGNVTVTGGSVNATSLVLQSYANAALSNAAAAINTTGKEAGKVVWNTDALKIYVANGASNVSVWYDAVGANAITPS